MKRQTSRGDSAQQAVVQGKSLVGPDNSDEKVKRKGSTQSRSPSYFSSVFLVFGVAVLFVISFVVLETVADSKIDATTSSGNNHEVQSSVLSRSLNEFRTTQRVQKHPKRQQSDQRATTNGKTWLDEQEIAKKKILNAQNNSTTNAKDILSAQKHPTKHSSSKNWVPPDSCNQVMDPPSEINYQTLTDRANGTKPRIFIIGLPKAGTTSVAKFFQSGGFRTCDYMCEFPKPPHLESRGFLKQHFREGKKDIPVGVCMLDAIRKGLPPIASCGDFQVYGEMDYLRPLHPHRTCTLPQIEMLEDIHQEHPDAVFILNTRQVQNWTHSVMNWPPYAHRRRRMHTRIMQCKAGPLTERVLQKEKNNDDEWTPMSLPQAKQEELMMTWYCEHMDRIRHFAQSHPSHILLEIDIASSTTGSILSSFFGVNEAYWQNQNQNSRLLKLKYPNWNGTKQDNQTLQLLKAMEVDVQA